MLWSLRARAHVTRVQLLLKKTKRLTLSCWGDKYQFVLISNSQKEWNKKNHTKWVHSGCINALFYLNDGVWRHEFTYETDLSKKSYPNYHSHQNYFLKVYCCPKPNCGNLMLFPNAKKKACCVWPTPFKI